MSDLYNQMNMNMNMNMSPARNASPFIRPNNNDAESLYLTELMQERQKLAPFMQVLPNCTRLLNQEIAKLARIIPKQGFGDYDLLQRGSPSPMSPFELTDMGGKCPSPWNGGGWHGMQQQLQQQHERVAAGPQGLSMDWQAPPGSPNNYLVKRILRLDIPVDIYPNFNFVGRLLGPRGNSLKRVEATTGCRVFIRGRGSIKDPEKEESLRGRPGYEHLSEPLHILVEADMPAQIIDVRLRQAQEIIEELLKPVDEAHDMYKRQQLKELAILNSNSREGSPQLRGSVSPFGSSGMKRAKTGW